MALIETTTFRLRDDATEAVFLAADKAVQTEVAYQESGILRRTTARGHGPNAGEWIVIELWADTDAADAGAAHRALDPLAQQLRSQVDPDTLDVRRYGGLD